MDTLVISPHLDDAVFGCGSWLASHPGARVVTVFAGQPADAAYRLTEWDAASGFRSVAEAIKARRREDTAALAQLQATPCWLEFLDCQYLEPATVDAMAAALLAVLGEHADAHVLMPLGLFHSDHLTTHAAAWQAVLRLPNLQPWFYEDAVHRARPGALQQRLAALHAEGLEATPVWQGEDVTAAHLQTKAAAVAAYASQLRALGPQAVADLQRPERFWTLKPLPAPAPVPAHEPGRGQGLGLHSARPLM